MKLKENNLKIGIMGGTFNPIHNGHLIIAQAALEQLNLEKVVFVPSGNPPHKKYVEIESPIHREKMTLLATEDNPKFEYSNVEVSRSGKIYTSDTLLLLKRNYINHHYYFILGADSLLAIESWNKPDIIFGLCTIVVADRNNSDAKIRNMIEKLKFKYNADIIYIRTSMIDISSTDIRQLIHMGKSAKYLVPDKVLEYINENKLYM